MADHADGRIVIDTTIDIKAFEEELKKLREAAKRASDDAKSSFASGVAGGADKAAKAVDRVGTVADKSKGKIKSVGTTGQTAGKQAKQGMESVGYGASNAASRVDGLKSALGRITKIISVAAVFQKLFALGSEAVELGSNVTEVQNVVDTAFGSMSDKIEQFAESSIQQYGMSKLAAKQTASTYMAMARGMGIAENAASDMSIALTGLSGDVASFYNISQEEADTKLKSVFTGETETLKSLGVVMTQTNLDAYALANGFGKTTDKMTQAELVALRYQYVTDQLGMAQGDFAKTSGSWANQTRILSENWKEFLSIMGQGLIQALTPAVQLLNQLMSYLISAANTFSALMSKLFGSGNVQAQQGQAKAIAAAASAENDLAQNTKKAAAEAKRAAAGFDEMNILSGNGTGATAGAGVGKGTASVLPITTTIATPETSSVGRAIEKIKTMFGKLKDYILVNFMPTFTAWGGAFENLKEPVSNAFASIGMAVSNLWENTLKPAGAYLLGTWIPDISNTFSGTFAPIFSDVVGFAFEECAKDFEFLCQIIDKYVNDIWVPMMEIFRTVATDAMDSIRNMWNESGGELLTNLGKLKDGFRETWNNIYDRIIKPVVTRIQEVISWLWDKHLKKLWDNLVQFFASLGNCIMTVWNNYLSPLVNFIVAYFSPFITSAVNTIVDVVGTVVAAVSDVISAILKILRGLLDFITGVFSGNWKKAWGGLKTAFAGAWEGMWGIVKGVVNLIIDALNALWRGLYSAIAGVINGVGSIVRSFGNLLGQNWGFSVPSQPPVIPKLAQGAVIPPNRQFMAVLGDQQNGRNLEAPESLIRQIVREESGGSDRPLTLILKIGNKRFGSVVLESLRDLDKQNGSLELALT